MERSRRRQGQEEIDELLRIFSTMRTRVSRVLELVGEKGGDRRLT